MKDHVMTNNIQVKRKGSWRLTQHAETVNEVKCKYIYNRPFIINIVLMFDYLARSCMLLWNRKRAVHIFFNYDPKYNEMHYRVIPKDMPTDKSAKERLYNQQKIENANELEDLITLVRGHHSKKNPPETDIPSVRFIKGEEKQKLSENKYICDMGISEDLINSEPIVLVMDIENSEMQSAYCNLGCLVLYGPSQRDEKSSSFKDDLSSKDAVINWSRIFSKFFAENSNITNETYLPSYKRRHSTKAAILIGDITNFTQLTGLLRIVQGTPQECGEELGEILREHCEEMSAIACKYRGRIERFMGDGLMVIFGEHEEAPRIAVGNAVAAATSMVKKFRKRCQIIQSKIGGESAENEINEIVELDFSVGINYGSVFFDYLGDEKHREYSCIGDHVTFANRLMSKAARFDTDTGDKWPPILISQTAEQYLENDCLKGNWKKDRDEARRILHVKGYGYPSYVYALETNKFDEDKYKKIMDTFWDGKVTEEEVLESLKKK